MSKLLETKPFDLINNVFPICYNGKHYKIHEIKDDEILLEDRNSNIINIKKDEIKWLFDGIKIITNIQNRIKNK